MKKIFLPTLALLCFLINAHSQRKIASLAVLLGTHGVQFEKYHAAFNADTIKYSTPLGFCLGENVVLEADGITGNPTFQWLKDGVAIAGATNVSYTAITSGVYSVVVTNTPNPPVSYSPVTVTVQQIPVASFSFSPNNSCSNQLVTFTNNSFGSGLTYQWSFGDPNSGSSNSSTNINPTHSFIGLPGNSTQSFDVKLIATTSLGCVDSTIATVTTKQIPDGTLGGTGYTIINGSPYFRQCNSTNATLSFTNQSTTLATNLSYKIIWGDGAPDFNAGSFSATSHNYVVGTYTLQFVVTGQNGCVSTTLYTVFVGSNPAIGIVNPGNTSVCTGNTITFPITGSANNPPGTQYSVSFNDVPTTIIYEHPPPANVSYTFLNASCGTTSSNGTTAFPNSFAASIVASNPCGSSAGSVVPIYVSRKPIATITATPGDTVCVNTIATFSNTSVPNQYIDNGTCISGTAVWKITPATGWTVSSGSLGNDFGLPDPTTWQSGTNSIGINFSTPGIYTIKLINGNPKCGLDSVIRTICVNPSPTGSFTLSQTNGCASLTVNATSNSNTLLCGQNQYLWNITYASFSGCPSTNGATYIGNTNATSANPQFSFSNPGTYSVRLTITSPGGCTFTTPVQTITVRTPPTANITTITNACGSATISPTVSTTNCGANALSYLWNFPGGNPATSTSQNPGNIFYNAPGNYTVTVAVTNECGTTTATRNFTVNPVPVVTVPANQVFCPGATAGPFTLSSSLGTVSWNSSTTGTGLPASGSATINAFTTINTTANPITTTVTASATSNSCTGQSTFTITVNPRPAAPTVSPISYCQGSTANPLTATAASGNTLTWYTNAALTGGSATAPTPSTATPGTTAYYVTQTNTHGCVSLPSTLNVTVTASIANNNIAADQTICAGITANQIVHSGPAVSGGTNSYTYSWQLSTNGGTTWNIVPLTTTSFLNPGSPTTTSHYRRIIISGACADTSNIVIITVLGSLSNYNISTSQTICQGETPATLTGQTPIGGNGNFSFQWQSSPNATGPWTNISGATGNDYSPPALTSSLYYKRVTTSGQCNANSNVLLITVKAKPSGTLSPATASICSTSAGTLSFSGTGVAPYVLQITVTNPDASTTVLTPTLNSNTGTITVVPANSAPGNYTISLTGLTDANNCPATGTLSTAVITVKPMPVLVTSADTIICHGTNISLTASGANSYSWNPGGQTTATITLTPASTITYTVTGTTDGCASSKSIQVTVNPTPVIPDQSITTCSESAFTVTPSNGGTTIVPAGTTYAWGAPVVTGGLTGGQAGNGPSIIGLLANPTNTSQTAVYTITPTSGSNGACVGNSFNLTVTVNPQPGLTDTTLAICSGATFSLLPSGAPANTLYSWIQPVSDPAGSITGGSAQNNQALISQSLTNTTNTIASLYYTVTPTGPGSCGGSGFTVKVRVAPRPVVPAFTATICTGNAFLASPQNGQPSATTIIPAGTTYTWSLPISNPAGAVTGGSAENSSQSNISQLLQNLSDQPATLTYNVIPVSGDTGSCAGIAFPVVVTVNPDAKALFTWTKDTACAPFVISNAVLALQHFPGRNGSYQWFANNMLIGTGNSFPGYTIGASNDSVMIKLVAFSANNCKVDSMEHMFYTYLTSQPAFTQTDSIGCGPLTVTFTNTTPALGQFNYYWEFGNGQTSFAAQPGPIVFEPHPNSGDTIYVVKMHVLSSCDTITLSSTVRVKSKPKALFTPNASTGCSPMNVTFSNISKGLGNTYTWNFGDGSPELTTSQAGNISHTFITGIQDTFYVKLYAYNECGMDSIQYAIVVFPNSVVLDFAINGNQQTGCAPHTVSFINNSQGASAFTWNFGDGTITNTTLNIDTITHTYLNAGTYIVTLQGSNGCSDTSSTETITVYQKPVASFTANPVVACIGTPVAFTNQSNNATSYLWKFGDGNTSTATNPSKTYATPGLYQVKLIAYRFNTVGSICTDSTIQQIQIVDTLNGWFTLSDSVSSCAPLTVSFTNQNLPAASAIWNFGDGNTGSGNTVTHTYTQAGTYIVQLVSTAPTGCVFTTVRTIIINGPSGTWTHSTGFICNATASFQVMANNADSFIYNFGDGNILTTTSNTVFHTYLNPGSYFPSVTIKNTAGCSVPLTGIDSIKIERIKAGFTAAQQNFCGYTMVAFTDTSHVFFGKAGVLWDFGDGNTGSGISNMHQYNTTGTYTVQMIVNGNSGCADTVTKQLQVFVKSKPFATIQGDNIACTGKNTTFTSNIQSIDAINFIKWTLSNGAVSTSNTFAYTFTQPGNYTLQLVAGTVNGCYDTVMHSITVNISPTVSTTNDLVLCIGNSAVLNTSGTGVVSYNWTPLQGLSCTSCASPTAAPLVTTAYVVEAKNIFGCSANDTVVVTVIQPLNLTVSPSDTICIGSSANLLVSGGTTYSWSPAAGLNSTTISNPTASPMVTTNFRVVGSDGFNCFTDTAFVLVVVGQYPTVNLGPDLTFPTGTVHSFAPVIQNGPIASWNWTPSNDLSCSNCPNPSATIRKDITYIVKATNIYGCSASDTIRILATCESSQVFIPNAFTPDGDGINDILMVRGKGIQTVKTFRIFNRWGEVVFERANFPANNSTYGWTGAVRGVIGGPDVFVYTAEVICDNGSTFTYKGNVSILK